MAFSEVCVSVRPSVCMCHLVSSWGPFCYLKDGEKDIKRRAKVSLSSRPIKAYTKQNLNALVITQDGPAGATLFSLFAGQQLNILGSQHVGYYWRL